MSLFSDIRSYFDIHIKAVNSSLGVIDDALNDEPLNNIEADQGYKLIFGELSSDRNGNAYFQDLPIELHIYKRPLRNELDNFDNLYCDAIDIKDRVISPVNAKNGNSWSDIFSSTITPGQEDTDDKTFNMRLNFIIRTDLFYS